MDYIRQARQRACEEILTPHHHFPPIPHGRRASEMDPVLVLKTVLSVIQSGTLPEDGASTPSQSSATVPPSAPIGAHPDATPSSLPELLAKLLSINATQLLVIGAFVEGLRRLFSMFWESAGDDLWLTASFEWDDDTTGASGASCG